MRISFAQAVYGSFPFWDRGYDVLARSPDCRPEWLVWLRATCPRVGQPPAGALIQGLFALKVDRQTWAVIGLSDQGTDDRGRPGAMAFHALFLSRRDYERLGADPFLMTPYLRSNWTADVRELPTGTAEIAPWNDRPTPSAEAIQIAAEIRAGRRRVIPAESPIDDLARQVWAALPIGTRRKVTLATWGFTDELGCDLQAVRGQPERNPPPRPQVAAGLPPLSWLRLGGILATVVGLSSVLALATVRLARRSDVPPTIESPRPPSRIGYGLNPKPEDIALVRDRLAVLADRLGLDLGTSVEPSVVMARLSESARYRGRWLGDDQREQLRRDPDPESARALAWDEHVRRFAPDRPLPADFDRGPVRWQLAVLAWSFHLDTADHEPPAELLQRLEDWLAVDVATRPSPLAGRYPALDDYGRFLTRLPRR